MKKIIKMTLKIVNTPFSWIEYKRQKFKRINERPIEFGFLFNKLVELNPKTILDIGTGTSALPSLLRKCGYLVTATDNIKDYWKNGMYNKHFYVVNDDITKTKMNKKFDCITCISVLEHIIEYNEAISSMSSLLNNGGYIVLTFPYKDDEYVKNAYAMPSSTYGQDASYITQMFSANEVKKWVKNNKLKVIDQEYWQFFSGDYWTVGEQIFPPKKVEKYEKHQLTCLVLKKI